MQNWINEYIKGLSSAEYHLQTTLVFIFLCFILFKIFKTYHRYRYIDDTATSRIASAAQGYVELTGLGELLPGSNTLSPFSLQRCLWYQCIVEKRHRMENKNHWQVESSETSDHLFVIQDDTGECVIIPDGAHVVPSQNRVWYGSSHQARFQSAINSGRWGSIAGFAEYRFTEKLILVADSLYATGFFETKQKYIQADALKQQVNRLLQNWKNSPERYLSAFDSDKNGNISQQEWDKIRLHAEGKILEQQQHTVHHTLKKPQHSNQPFIISALPEQELLKRKKLWIFFYLLLFFFLLYIFVTALNAQ